MYAFLSFIKNVVFLLQYTSKINQVNKNTLKQKIQNFQKISIVKKKMFNLTFLLITFINIEAIFLTTVQFKS